MSLIHKFKEKFNNLKNTFFVILAVIMGMFIIKANNKEKEKKELEKGINKSEGKKEVLGSVIKENEDKMEEVDDELEKLQQEVKEIFKEENDENLDDFFDKRGF